MTGDKPVVYVVDDDPSVLRALERLLRSADLGLETFTSALDFLNFQHPEAPGCLILDVKMPGVSGLELQERMARQGILFPIIFITGHGTVPLSVQAMKAGAVDFLMKPFDPKDLLEIVFKALDKDRQAKWEQRELKRLRERLKTLTPREAQVFRSVVAGMLNKQIAYDLGTAEKTIKVHRARIMEKMGAKSLAELVRFAEKLGIGSPSS
ncbi:MAG: response regulator transcription factor [Deltaproteobacteria bacterium]|nr:response regulator transcription factor [Deltaproteobacteria bacterium]